MKKILIGLVATTALSMNPAYGMDIKKPLDFYIEAKGLLAKNPAQYEIIFNQATEAAKDDHVKNILTGIKLIIKAESKVPGANVSAFFIEDNFNQQQKIALENLVAKIDSED